MKQLMKTTQNPARLALIALVLGAAALGGCRGDRSERPPRQFLPDMDDSPKFKPQTKTEFFEDGRAMRQSVEGTVAFGASTDAASPARAGYLREDDAFYRGVSASGEFLERIPASVTVDMDLLLKGQEKYNIYCAACHNYDGHGKGLVGEQWSYPLPNFHDAKYKPGAMEEIEDPATKQKKQVLAKTGKDGYIFNTIRYGVENGAKMPGYGHALKPADAWAVVAYYRALQTSESGSVSADVPADKRSEVQKLIDKAKAEFEAAKQLAAAAAAAEEAAKKKTPAAPAPAPEKK